MKSKKWIGMIQIFCLSLAMIGIPAIGFASDGDPDPDPDDPVTAMITREGGDYAGFAATAPTSGVVNVSTSAELAAAISNAAAGTTIVLADGTYTQSGSFSVSNKNGTETQPITIMAANLGKAVMTGRAGFNVSNSSYVVIQGLKFTGTATAVTMNSCHHVRVTRNTFALANVANPSGFKWLQFTGSKSHHNQIDHNEFGPRLDLGQMIAFQGSVMSQYDVIEYNYFHDAAPQTENGGETIRVGLSGSSMSDGFATIQYNLFVNCDSDAEVVSVKSGHNTVRYNTFINNKGQVTARHGHGNSYYGNFFFRTGNKSGVGGFRIYANDQKIYNNYFENISGTIHIDGGDFDAGPDGSNFTSNDLAKHWRVYRAQVFHNTIVNSSSGIVVGKSYTYAPVDSIVANNIVVGSGGPLYSEVKSSNTVFQGNIGFGGTLDNVPRTTSEMMNINPLFTTIGNLQKLTDGSPAIDAAVGSFPNMTEDMDGQPRTIPDIGADEYSSSPIIRHPLTTADVGPNGPEFVPPVTTAAITPAQPDGQNGWYVSPVTVTLAATDDYSGVAMTEYSLDSGTTWQPYTGSVTFSQNGYYTMSYRSKDSVGNIEQPKAISFNLDMIAPVIAVSIPVLGNSYPDSGDLLLQPSISDDLSGVDNSKTTITLDNKSIQQGTAVPLYTLPLGFHQLTVTAGDVAGNARNVSVTFSTYADLDSLQALVTRFAGMMWIDNAGIVNSLQSKLDHGDINEFMHEVQAQAGKHITTEASTYLLRDAQAIIDANNQHSKDSMTDI